MLPPLAPTIWELTPAAASVQSHTTAGGTYSGPLGPSDRGGSTPSAVAACMTTPRDARMAATFWGTDSVILVNAPGMMTLQVTPYDPTSLATARVTPMIAA